MSLLKTLQLDPPKTKPAAPDAAVEAEKATWRARLKALTAVGQGLKDPAAKAALADDVRQAAELTQQADRSKDAALRLKLYRSAIEQLGTAESTAKKADKAHAAAAAMPVAPTKATALPAAAGAAAAGTPAKPAEAKKAGGPMPFSLAVPGLPSLLKKKVSLGKAQFEIQIKPKLTIAGKAELDDTDRTKISSAGVKVALAWYEKEGAAAVADKGLLGNAKIEFKGTSLAATTSTKTKLGLVTLTMTFVGIGGKVGADLNAKAAVKVLEAEGELEPAAIKLGDQEVLGVKVSELEVKLGGSVTVAPEWKAMLIQWAVEEAAKRGLTEAGEAIVVGVGADVVIAGSFVVAGVATIGGAIYSIVRAWGVGDLAKSYSPAVEAAKAGFKAAMSGGAAPGDQFGKVGWDQGRANYQQLFDKTKKENPSASDDAVRTAIAAKADDALKLVANEIDRAIRAGMWDGYLGRGKTLLFGDEARWAYVACFGDEPNSQNPDKHWKKYMDLYPTQSKTSPK